MPVYRFTAYNYKLRTVSGEFTAKDETHLSKELAKIGLKLKSAKPKRDRRRVSPFDALYWLLDKAEDLARWVFPDPKQQYDPSAYIRLRKARSDIRSHLARGSTDRMPTFSYVARSRHGGTLSGEMEAFDVNDLANRLLLLELTLVRVVNMPDNADKPFRAMRALTPRDLLILSQQLELYFTLDMTVPQMLDAIRQSCGSKPLKALLWRVSEHMRTDKDSLSDAMARYPHLFSRFFLGIVTAGERAGELPLALHYARKHLVWQLNFRRNMWRQLKPMLVSCLVTWGFFATEWLGLLLLPPLLYYTVKTIRHRLPTLDTFLLALPRLGRLWQRYDTATIVYLFAILWRAGLPVDRILETARHAVTNAALRHQLDAIRLEVARGQLLSEAFKATLLFPPFVIAAIKLGERTGQFELSLEEVYYFYTRALDDAAYYFILQLRYGLLFLAAVPLLWYALGYVPLPRIVH